MVKWIYLDGYIHPFTLFISMNIGILHVKHNKITEVQILLTKLIYNYLKYAKDSDKNEVLTPLGC